MAATFQNPQCPSRWRSTWRQIYKPPNFCSAVVSGQHVSGSGSEWAVLSVVALLRPRRHLQELASGRESAANPARWWILLRESYSPFRGQWGAIIRWIAALALMVAPVQLPSVDDFPLLIDIFSNSLSSGKT